mmetsp:Transcript_30120/g.65740  ORF Transcript_30120/g.65740 Transcript_30120/m.65740 type:complete len:277 (-) Transcript_30120:87-917(-)
MSTNPVREDEAEHYGDEEAPLLELDETDKRAAVIAYSHLRSMSVAIHLCFTIFLFLVMMRLQFTGDALPLLLDFLPLLGVPGLLFFAAVDFAATRMVARSDLGRRVVVIFGFIAAMVQLLISVLVFMKIRGLVSWNWSAILFPFWFLVLGAQLVLAFLMPGFQRYKMLPAFGAIFVMVWMVALSVLLVGLKLDHRLAKVWWGMALLPAGIVVLLQLVGVRDRLVNTLCRAAVLLSLTLIALHLDGIVAIPWSLILCPVILALGAHAYEVRQEGREG